MADHESDKWAGMENQESSVNTDVENPLTADDINMEDIVITSTQSSDIAEKTIADQRIYYGNLWLPLPPKVSRRIQYILNIAKTRAKLTCPNWDCKGREIETLITQDLFKETGKPTSSTADVTKPVDSGNQTPVDDDVALMDELGLLDGKEQSSSKTADVAKETSDQATSPIEVVSTTSGNSEKCG
ncbi:hypothetical protein C1645_746317 [Glomus cerebriforme]|uniref:Uncharacterized protein n=1 Tax=Glomus cerebriforme TaxID=658196 RepID=A0A397S205_9GLOM|nr:hypothetical protein C1645_746317 [Glomus cerebriforme]